MKVETAVNCEYLLSKTAIRIWEADDKEGQNKMLEIITNIYKEKWFRGMIYKSNIIPVYQLREIAEDAFIYAWKDFNERGKAGKINFKETEYTPYFKQSLRNIFIKLIKKEIKEREILKEYVRRTESVTEEDERREKLINEKLQKTLNTLSDVERELIQMRFVKKLSHSVIAGEFKILKKSCIQKLYRAKQNFIKNWKSDNNNDENT